ncbi:thioredoxin family protein [Pedobacter sp. V48]|uniref:DUF1223 domain-containing protein n=1 Tax=Pedobacter sp. V48 TaxID=509635 RepID=UPI0003E56C78|nr:DUF1223 domain-containing protein [Pedobacter sp. V48]ETZ24121.1 hypothetical protein N824_16410 [Pedobacter sp. V48]
MKRIQLTMLCALAVILLLTATLANRSMASKSSISQTIKGDGFVVLELFTSEGCSSCPPADELLAKVQRAAGDKPVYALSYHVDYWDNQGWRDVFSNPDYSKRQYDYASKLRAQVYTPQVVVNGKTEFVGSNESAMNYAIESSLTGSSVSTLQLQGKQQGGKMTLSYQVTGKTSEDELLIAIVQKKAVHQIKRGENEGRTLRHAQIVRSLQTFQLDRSENGQLSLELPKAYNTAGWEIIGLLQDKKSKAIHSATRAI